MFAAVMMQRENFLEFVGKDTASNNTEIQDPYVKQLQRTIRNIKESREMEHWFQGAWATSEFKKGKVEGKAEGKAEERKAAIFELLEELGEVSETLSKRIMSEENSEVLRVMFKQAAKAESLEQFKEKIANR